MHKRISWKNICRNIPSLSNMHDIIPNVANLAKISPIFHQPRLPWSSTGPISRNQNATFPPGIWKIEALGWLAAWHKSCLREFVPGSMWGVFKSKWCTTQHSDDSWSKKGKTHQVETPFRGEVPSDKWTELQSFQGRPCQTCSMQFVVHIRQVSWRTHQPTSTILMAKPKDGCLTHVVWDCLPGRGSKLEKISIIFKDVKGISNEISRWHGRKITEHQASLDSLHWSMAWPDPLQTLIYSYSTPSLQSIVLKGWFGGRVWFVSTCIYLVYANWNSLLCS